MSSAGRIGTGGATFLTYARRKDCLELEGFVSDGGSVILTGAVYLDETMLIPKNTSVIIKRLPKPGSVNLLARLSSNTPLSASMMYGDYHGRQRKQLAVDIPSPGHQESCISGLARKFSINQWFRNGRRGPTLEVLLARRRLPAGCAPGDCCRCCCCSRHPYR